MQRYDLIIAREGKDGRSYWTKIGSGFPARSGEGFSLSFDALPMPGKDGGCWVQMRVPQERNSAPEAPRARTVTSGRPIPFNEAAAHPSLHDDDIPF